ncbi:MAG: hypothetical protein QNJ90_09770 [Planctomycetota bacterium]|nr:hypothetical protein [Planctomycetota bacterium]
MSKRFLLPLFVALLGAVWVGGCGSGGDQFTGGARSGPVRFALPFVPSTSGVSATIGMKNVTTGDAPVYITAYDSAGNPYGAVNQAFVVPGQGELRVPLAQIAGGPTNGGWVCVETRDVTTPQPVIGEPTPLPTTGFVFAYLHRELLGGNNEVDSTPGLAGRASGVTLPITPDTGRIQLINHSFDQNAIAAIPQAVLYRIETFDESGNQAGAAVTQFVAANGTFDWLPGVTTGYVRVEPIGAPFPPQRQIRYGLAARENGFHMHVESRYTEATLGHWPGLLDLGFDVNFGTDEAGNVHDFGLLLNNPTGSSESLSLIAVYRKGGAPVLTIPRGYVLGAGRTVYMRTTTRDSIGLLQGEDSWFDDIFGDVFATQTFDEVTLYVQAPRSLDVSVRHFDPSFNAFYQVQRAIPRSNRACVFDLPIQVSQAGGTRNYVSITNTTTSPLTVPIRGYTPMLGTEYILDSIEVPALATIDWSPDGQTFREEPTDTVGPPVSFMRFDFAPTTGALFRGRTEGRDPSRQLEFITPTAIRD